MNSNRKQPYDIYVTALDPEKPAHLKQGLRNSRT